MLSFKKVLVCCPTAKAKDYCFPEWIENVMQFTYPEFDIAMFDNTDDDGAYAAYLNQYVKENYGNLRPFKAINSIASRGIKTSSVINRMCISHNDCRKECLEGGYDCIVHIESDVFPEKDVIERLLAHGKNVVGGLYYSDEGRFRSAMVYERVELSPRNITTMQSSYFGGEIRLFDGTLKQVAMIGLGCILITDRVLKRIQFRHMPERNVHPDTYFSEDCELNNIPIHLDTSLICSHQNQSWGIYGVDYQ